MSLSQGLYLHTEQHNTRNKRTQTSIHRVGFEPKTPVFERAKTVHALDRAATVAGKLCLQCLFPIRIATAIYLSIYLSIYLWHYSPLLNLGRFFSVLILYTVGRTHWKGDQHFARPLPTHRINAHIYHASNGIRTHDLGVGASEDSLCLRPPGRCDRRHSNSYRKSMYNKRQVIFRLTEIQLTAGVKVIIEADLIGNN
jgi:hypothetical protein